VLIGRVARATLLALRDGRAAGDPVMRRAFDDWLEFQAPAPVPPDPGTIDADVLAIRNVIFMPGGGGVYGTTRWNAFDWPVSLPQYMVVNPDIVVKREGAAPMTVTLRQSLPRHPNVVFADRTDLEALTSVMRALGGTERGQPASVMATPNQPRGRSQEIRAFWNAYFPMRQGHWSGWELETYPTITDITFVDEARTKAEARVIIGYSGGTVLLVKERGVWRATEMTNFWIT
jgi:hypothetical protein